jgi:flagellar basal-body rod protein FlgC
MGYFTSLDISASGLTAQRLRMDTISQNIANANTTRTEKGTPYRRKTVVFEERAPASQFAEILNANINEPQKDVGMGVRVTKIVEDKGNFKKVYDPGHPDADKNGYVSYPNVDPITEMVNMISATRAYEANITAINSSKSMATRALEIGR